DGDDGRPLGADVNLILSAGFGSGNGLPTFLTDFHLGWQFGNASTEEDASTFGGDGPDISFTNVRMKLGDFLNNLVGPALHTIDRLIEPLKPVLNILTSPIPVLSQLAGHPIT